MKLNKVKKEKSLGNQSGKDKTKNTSFVMNLPPR